MAYLSVKAGRIEGKGGKGKKLTPKMVTFIDAYFGEANFNATRAYELSAYASTMKSPDLRAAELMNHPLVQQEIKRRQAIRTEKSEVKAEWIINKLQKIVNNTEDENPQAAIRAIELLGKTIAIWRDRQEISGPDGEAIKHEQHVKESVADFTRRISELVKRNGTDNVVSLPKRGGAS